MSIGLEADVAFADAAREVLRRAERIGEAAGLQGEADARRGRRPAPRRTPTLPGSVMSPDPPPAEHRADERLELRCGPARS